MGARGSHDGFVRRTGGDALPRPSRLAGHRDRLGPAPRHWGKGYATEAGAAAVEYAFANHPVDALYSVILPENTASQAVARRLGFTLWQQRALSHFPEMEHGIWRLQRTST